MRFTEIKSETLNLRVSPTFKQALKVVADKEQRSMANMLEVLLGNYCELNGITASSLPVSDGSPNQKESTNRSDYKRVSS